MYQGHPGIRISSFHGLNDGELNEMERHLGNIKVESFSFSFFGKY
ncbi:MAG: hypothetical protein ACFS24_00730 [Candidatus Karelsulcia muelleri]